MFQNFFKHIKSDLPSSIVVFLVAVPLCLGISLASGAPLMSGIIAGIVGGIVVTSFSGSSLGVSGPAAGLAVIVLVSIQEVGYEAFILAGLIGGGLQLLLGICRAGIVAYYFPSAVIKGMLAAIGIIIFLKQIPHAVGFDADYEGDMSFAQADGHNTFSELFYMLEAIAPSAVIISVIGLLVLILWEMKFIKQNNFLNKIPAPLLVVVIGILLNILFINTGFYPLSQDQMVNIPIIGSLSGIKEILLLPDFSQITNPAVWRIGAVIAVVASLESLLSLEATDKLDPKKRISSTNRELRAQGIGNLCSSLIGGLPVTQVIVRSSANIQSGAQSRTSAFLHGVWILLCVLFIPHILNLIPLSSLAAVLMLVGFKLAKPSLFMSMKKAGWQQFIPFVVTVVAIVFTDLLTGIIIGMVVAVYFILYNNYQKPFYMRIEEKENGEKQVHIKLAEDVTFLNKARILHTLKMLPKNSTVVIDASETANMDDDVLEIIKDYSEDKTHAYNVVLHGFHETKNRDAMNENKQIMSQYQSEGIKG